MSIDALDSPGITRKLTNQDGFIPAYVRYARRTSASAPLDDGAAVKPHKPATPAAEVAGCKPRI